MKLRRLVSLALGASLAAMPVVPGVLSAPAPAQAAGVAVVAPSAALKAKSGITIAKIGTKSVKGTAKVTIKPSVKATGKVKVTKKVLTVKKGAKVVAKNKTSVKLAAGTYKVTTKVYYKTYRLSGSVKKFSATKSFSATQTLKVKRVAAASSGATSTGASSAGNCPSWAPIKANNNSGIYHVPGGRYYAKTTANVTCYVSQAAAASAGFRASQS